MEYDLDGFLRGRLFGTYSSSEYDLGLRFSSVSSSESERGGLLERLREFGRPMGDFRMGDLMGDFRMGDLPTRMGDRRLGDLMGDFPPRLMGDFLILPLLSGLSGIALRGGERLGKGWSPGRGASPTVGTKEICGAGSKICGGGCGVSSKPCGRGIERLT